MKLRFFHCDICGKDIAVLSDTDIPTVCCGQTMKELKPNRTDGAIEKHVPVFSVMNNTVTVKIGSAPHPMTDIHSIKWVGLSTDKGLQFKELYPGDDPVTEFRITPEETVQEAFSLCNLHGLWSS